MSCWLGAPTVCDVQVRTVRICTKGCMAEWNESDVDTLLYKATSENAGIRGPEVWDADGVMTVGYNLPGYPCVSAAGVVRRL